MKRNKNHYKSQGKVLLIPTADIRPNPSQTRDSSVRLGMTK